MITHMKRGKKTKIEKVMNKMFELKNKKALLYKHDENAYTFEVQGNGENFKKVSSRFLPLLLGKSKFDSIGYSILERNRLLKTDDQIDTWYKIRGAIGEYFAELQLKKDFEKMEGFETQRFATNQFKHFDQFHADYKWGSKTHGGTVDIAIKKPEKARAVVEVKSKSLEKEETIKKMHDEIKENPELVYENDEILQGLQLAVLSKVQNLFMAYVLFPSEIENKMQEVQSAYSSVEDFDDGVIEEIIKKLGIKREDLTYIFKRIKVDTKTIKNKMQIAHDILAKYSKKGMIPKELFSKEEQAHLDRLVDETIEADKPF